MTVPPPPPPPPPAPPAPVTPSNSNPNPEISAELSAELSGRIHKAASLLETNRCLETEHEAALHFAATLLSNPAGLPHDDNTRKRGHSSTNIRVPAGVKDAWLALLQNSNASLENSTATAMNGNTTTNVNGANNSIGLTAAGQDQESYEYPLPKGQLARAIKATALSTSLHRASEIAQQLRKNKKADSQSCVDALKSVNPSDPMSSTVTPHWFVKAFDDKVQDIREYHARHPTVTGTGTTNNGHAADSTSLQMMIVDSNNLESSVLNAPNSKKRKIGNPTADGYDLHSILHQQLVKINSGQTFSVEEVMGKYLDLHPFHELFYTLLLSLNKKSGSGDNNQVNGSKISYPDFVTLLASGLNTASTGITSTSTSTSTSTTPKITLVEKEKLSQRKKYIRFLHQINAYLINFIHRVSPLLNVDWEVIRPALDSFHQEWAECGGVAGWECKPSDKILVVATSGNVNGNGNADGGANGNGNGATSSADVNNKSSININLQQFSSVEELMEQTTPDQLKMELARLGMKCGGKPMDRAKRLWCARDTPLENLPAKLFTKQKGSSGSGSATAAAAALRANDGIDNHEDTTAIAITLALAGGNQRRIDIARMEGITHALLNQLRPTLDATARRAERRLTQTFNEKEREMEEEISGTYEDSAAKGDGEGNGGENDSDSDDDDAPIYNPKGVPLGWDGKPIPYWLFKLHGLNHFYSCEICGNESYRGRHNFEKHFAEAKHSYGMKCLEIPNTKHFHGVTKIEDAQNLWRKLQEDVNKDVFDASKEEEYEDSQGNVLSRATYEDLARQGLL